MYKDIYSLIIYNDKNLESASNRKVAKYSMAIWGNSMKHEKDGHVDWGDRNVFSEYGNMSVTKLFVNQILFANFMLKNENGLIVKN